MTLKTKEQALLVKLVYQNGSILSIVLWEYRRSKACEKDQAWKKRCLNSKRLGRGRNRILNETAEEVALAVVERESAYPVFLDKCSSRQVPSIRQVSHDSFLPGFIVRKILWFIIKFYPYKIQVVQAQKPACLDARTQCAMLFLTRIVCWQCMAVEHFEVGRGEFHQRCSSEYSKRRVWSTA